jgi:hypothetical protein
MELMADVQSSLLTYFYNLLTDDATLKSAMGGTVRCYPVEAPTDVAFPYIVHRIDAGPPGGIWPQRNSTYQVDVWSRDPAATEITTIRNRLMLLVDELVFNTTDVKNCRPELQTDGFITEPGTGADQNIWHYAIQFNLPYYRQTETTSILAR